MRTFWTESELAPIPGHPGKPCLQCRSSLSIDTNGMASREPQGPLEKCMTVLTPCITTPQNKQQPMSQKGLGR